ncbi:hypothetical protein PsorP6_002734 [Peronosclerospora sorghi]|uniref:Uncharacterized protein n=1 Tax=Peronosclerospora sorghi TaxID=230839 RepID=A0ACC0WYC8_9STRA|nr:hypothetical protein PsorP6_002734 [Peronosclerospora sorghi]
MGRRFPEAMYKCMHTSIQKIQLRTNFIPKHLSDSERYVPFRKKTSKFTNWHVITIASTFFMTVNARFRYESPLMSLFEKISLAVRSKDR